MYFATGSRYLRSSLTRCQKMDCFDKGAALLRFLKESATLRRPRVPQYRSEDRVLYLSKIPQNSQEIRTPFIDLPKDDSFEFWFEVKKTRPPVRPLLPDILHDWVREEELDSPQKEPGLKKEIIIQVEREILDPEAPAEAPRTIKEIVDEIHYLKDHPEVEEAWIEYYINHWEPWAAEMRRWKEVNDVYEEVDYMRRRLEEAEEIHELLLGVGLLQWRDSTGVTIKRHLLTGPAEISFEAARGRLTIMPASNFDTFKIELDMLDLADRPRLEGSAVQEKLEDLDIQAWDNKRVGEILWEIANRMKSDALVEEEAWKPDRPADNIPRIYFAPALILRERRPTAFEEVVTKLVDNFDNRDENFKCTKPWEIFVREGQATRKGESVPEDSDRGIDFEHEYFHLPTNEEQRQIVRRLQRSPAVVVKGPPGTGKSHTIANLICHLLAVGEKILITAQAPKALTVLRDMLPRGQRDLCLIALGSSREDQRQLESGVRTIIGRKNRWDQGEGLQADEKIRKLEQELRSLRASLARLERELREYREAETFSHERPGGYHGTAARIAQRLEEERERFGWFPEALPEDSSFPFTPSEVRVLAQMHASLTPEDEQELQKNVGDFVLPSPEDFRTLIKEIQAAEEKADETQDRADGMKLSLIHNVTKEALEKAFQALRLLDEYLFRTERILGDLTKEIATDGILGENHKWSELFARTSEIIRNIETLSEEIGNPDICLPGGRDVVRVRADAERLLTHLEQGKWRGFLCFKPKIIRETEYLIKECRVNSSPVTNTESLNILINYLKIKEAIKDFINLWPDAVAEGGNPDNLFQFCRTAQDKVSALGGLLEVFDKNGVAESLSCIPSRERVILADSKERSLWLDTLEAKLAQRTLQEVRRPLDEFSQIIHNCLESERAHPCLYSLAKAFEERDDKLYKEAFEVRENLRLRQQHYQQYQDMMARLEEHSSPLASLIRQHQGDPQWQPRLVDLERAWHWASAKGWLERVADRQRYEELVEKYPRLKEKIEKITAELASERAWQAFFQRLDPFTIQNLISWSSAIDRVGKGTGKYAYRHRRDAREYLKKCLPKIPAWIMPLHKLWDTIEPNPGLFDTIIIDEASQADLTSLLLLLLAKRIIVVGDKMQNSPEAVGVREDDINRLIKDHLKEFHFRAEFRPDTSLFDHAERGFGNLISLREHFRCVPEIIRFSNDLCYRDAPLVPLRQAPVDRLPPLQHIFVPGGFCEGDGQSIRNEVEADALVQTVLQCLQNEAYEGKSVGVVVLQGRAQAELIERKLAACLDPAIISERKLRCGVPATFQGDQRDVIFLSLVISPERRFRALTDLDSQRRFNVAMSRARDQVWLFHSVQQSDLRPDCLRHRLLRFFQSPWQESSRWETEELERLEREAARRKRRPGEQPDPFESWFEVDVALELLRQKYRVIPQYEVAGYRIDLVVEGRQSRLAVECDGDAWHGPESYDKDMARQRQLERAGWTFVRVRESEFYLDRNRAIEEIVKECRNLEIFPVDMDFELLQQGEGEKGTEAETAPEKDGEEESAEPEDITQEAIPVSGPFTGYTSELDFPDPREASIINICLALKEIITRDGPLTLSSLYRLYMEGCPYIQRAGRAVRERLSLAVRNLVKAGEIIQEDELRTGKPEGIVVRMAGAPSVRLRPTGRRKLEEIPPSEIFLLMERLHSHKTGTGPEHEEILMRKILEHYGFSQLTRTRRKYLHDQQFKKMGG
jgi:very-short-patch-repair endonuclease